MGGVKAPRVAVIAPILGIPSEVWIARQAQAFRAVTPVLMSWRTEAGWQAPEGIETRMIPGLPGSEKSLIQRIERKLGLARAERPSAAQIRMTRAAIEAARVQAVLCHFAWTAMAVAPALPPGMPLILHVHGRDVSALMVSKAYRKALAQVLARSQALIAVGRHQVERLRPLGLPARTRVIPCGAPLELFAAGPMPVQAADGPLRFVSVGRMSAEKGMRESLAAFEAIAGEFPQAELVLIGFGPDHDAIAAAAAASPLAARIRLTGRLDPETIARELSAAQVYLQHSREVGGWVEGFGVTLTEAGAAGLPLLASASGGLVDQIEEGVNGFLFREGDVAAQAALMRRLAADPAERARLGEGARRLAARFDTARMAAELEAEILAVIGKDAA